MTKTCIISPEVLGPHQNGGVGTHTYWLARTLAAGGCEVTFLYSGQISYHDNDYWVKYFSNYNIEFVHLDSLNFEEFSDHFHNNLTNSFKIYQYLKDKDFDTLHFQDMEANAFHCLQARQSLGEFSNSRISVTLHGSIEWVSDAMRMFDRNHLYFSKRSWFERYCVRHADHVISPSKYMVEWMKTYKWMDPVRHVEVVASCYMDNLQNPHAKPKPGRFALFGRLETRKGLILMLDALAQLTEEQKSKIDQIYFVGKVGQTGYGPADNVIRRRMRKIKVPYTLKSDLHSREALQYMIDERVVAVLPSTVDNFPYTAIECCTVGIPAIGSNSSGIAEIFHPSQLFSPTVEGLRDALARNLENKYVPKKTQYDAKAANAAWFEINERIAAELKPAKPKRASKSSARKTIAKPKLISVCVAPSPYSSEIEQTLNSIANSKYKNIEILAIRDPENEPPELLAGKKNKLQVKWLDFIDNENGCASRNRLAKNAKGEFLAFIDAGNFVSEDYLDCMISAIQHAKVAAVCCSKQVTIPLEEEKAGKLFNHVETPTGQNLELGVLENTTGDINFLIRKTVFRKMSGFADEIPAGSEDWEFWTRFTILGHKMVVVPKTLIRGNRRKKKRNDHEDFVAQSAVLNNYRPLVDEWQWRLMRNILAPSHMKPVKVIKPGANGANANEKGAKPDKAANALSEEPLNSEKWIRDMTDKNYVEEVRFFAEFLENHWLGRFIRRSKAAKSMFTFLLRKK